jgi:hypothetical protein
MSYFDLTSKLGFSPIGVPPPDLPLDINPESRSYLTLKAFMGKALDIIEYLKSKIKEYIAKSIVAFFKEDGITLASQAELSKIQKYIVGQYPAVMDGVRCDKNLRYVLVAQKFFFKYELTWMKKVHHDLEKDHMIKLEMDSYGKTFLHDLTSYILSNDSKEFRRRTHKQYEYFDNDKTDRSIVYKGETNIAWDKVVVYIRGIEVVGYLCYPQSPIKEIPAPDEEMRQLVRLVDSGMNRDEFLLHGARVLSNLFDARAAQVSATSYRTSRPVSSVTLLQQQPGPSIPATLVSATSSRTSQSVSRVSVPQSDQGRVQECATASLPPTRPVQDDRQDSREVRLASSAKNIPQTKKVQCVEVAQPKSKNSIQGKKKKHQALRDKKSKEEKRKKEAKGSGKKARDTRNEQAFACPETEKDRSSGSSSDDSSCSSLLAKRNYGKSKKKSKRSEIDSMLDGSDSDYSVERTVAKKEVSKPKPKKTQQKKGLGKKARDTRKEQAFACPETEKDRSSGSSSDDSSCSSLLAKRNYGKSKKNSKRSEIDSMLDGYDSDNSIERTVAKKEVSKPKPKKTQQKKSEGRAGQKNTSTSLKKAVNKTRKVGDDDDESDIGEVASPDTIRKIRKWEYDEKSKCLRFHCAWSGYGKKHDTVQKLADLEEFHFIDERHEYALFIRKYISPFFLSSHKDTLFIHKNVSFR